MWTLLTLFKNKSPTFYSFINFYNKYWLINNFIYFIGYTKNKHEIIEKYFSDCDFYNHVEKIDFSIPKILENIEIYKCQSNKNTFTLILYKTDQTTNCNNWNLIKSVLEKIIFQKISKSDNLLYVDDDEFLYSNNIDSIKKKSMHRFHFVEYICNDTFDKNKLSWSLQAWNNIQIVRYENKDNILKNNSDDRYSKYTCYGCKQYGFKLKNRLLDNMIHSGNITNNKDIDNVCCKLNFNKSNELNINNISDEELNKILLEGVCFHFISLTKKQLIDIKQNNRFSDANWTADKLLISNEKIFKYYRVIENNILSSIISEKDIENI